MCQNGKHKKFARGMNGPKGMYTKKTRAGLEALTQHGKVQLAFNACTTQSPLQGDGEKEQLTNLGWKPEWCSHESQQIQTSSCVGGHVCWRLASCLH